MTVDGLMELVKDFRYQDIEIMARNYDVIYDGKYDRLPPEYGDLKISGIKEFERTVRIMVWD